VTTLQQKFTLIEACKEIASPPVFGLFDLGISKDLNKRAILQLSTNVKVSLPSCCTLFGCLLSLACFYVPLSLDLFYLLHKHSNVVILYLTR
jgi:hypothetical protein